MKSKNENSLNIEAAEAAKKTIEAYRAGNVGFPELVNQLNTMLNSMRTNSKEWQHKFMKSWGVLEEVNAVALEAGRTTIPPEHEDLVNNALNSILSLVQEIK